jgi:hypothetical protein
MKTYFTLMMVGICLLLAIPTKVLATSWAELEPQDVFERSEVIIRGSYNFSSNPKSSNFIFQGYEFNVKDVFKGEASEQIIVGIDGYDVGWAEEFQNDGGEFLLLLEKNEKANFLIPVGGPNGMIHVVNGNVQNESVDNQLFYQKILEGNKNEPQPKEHLKNMSKSNISKSNEGYYISSIFLVFLLVLIVFFIHRFKKKNK